MLNKPYFYSVVLTHEGVVARNFLLVGEIVSNKAIVVEGEHKGKQVEKAAEEIFISECRKIRDVDSEELDIALEEGYFTEGNWAVSIGQPEYEV